MVAEPGASEPHQEEEDAFETDERRPSFDAFSTESAQPGYEGEGFEYCGGGATPLLRLGGSGVGEGKRRDVRVRMRAAADKAERLGGCPLRSQYGSPLCAVM